MSRRKGLPSSRGLRDDVRDVPDGRPLSGDTKRPKAPEEPGVRSREQGGGRLKAGSPREHTHGRGDKGRRKSDVEVVTEAPRLGPPRRRGDTRDLGEHCP